MTLILAAQRPRPFIIGDLMLTRPGPGKRVETVLPSAGVINVNKWIQSRPDMASRYYFSGLAQKLCIINDSLVIGWAGSMFSAKLLIERLRSVIGRSIMSGADLNSILTANAGLLDGQLSLICMGLEGPTASECYVVGRNCYTVSTENFGEMMIAGTGAQQIIGLLPALRTYTMGEIIDGG